MVLVRIISYASILGATDIQRLNCAEGFIGWRDAQCTLHHMLHPPGTIEIEMEALLVDRNLQYLDISPTSSLLYISNDE